MYRSYTFRLKTTKRQSAMLSALLVQLCKLYNMCLEQRIAHYKQGKRTGYYDQQGELKELRAECPEYRALPAAIQRDSRRHLQRAFEAFFRRLKAGDRPGFPHFRSQSRYDSLHDRQNCGLRLSCDHNAARNILALGESAARVRAECLLK